MHQYPLHANIPQTNRKIWEKKLFGNMERVKKVTDYYIRSDWEIITIFKRDLKRIFEDTVDHIADFIISNRKSE